MATLAALFGYRRLRGVEAPVTEDYAERDLKNGLRRNESVRRRQNGYQPGKATVKVLPLPSTLSTRMVQP